jgi:hypothetical protein
MHHGTVNEIVKGEKLDDRGNGQLSDFRMGCKFHISPSLLTGRAGWTIANPMP